MTTSSTAQIRQKLEMAFDDSDLSAFSLDYFPTVYEKFSQGMRKDEKVTLLLDYCCRHPKGFEKLLDNVRQAYSLSNFQREELKPLIDILSVSSLPIDGRLWGSLLEEKASQKIAPDHSKNKEDFRRRDYGAK